MVEEFKDGKREARRSRTPSVRTISDYEVALGFVMLRNVAAQNAWRVWRGNKRAAFAQIMHIRSEAKTVR